MVGRTSGIKNDSLSALFTFNTFLVGSTPQNPAGGILTAGNALGARWQFGLFEWDTKGLGRHRGRRVIVLFLNAA